MGTVVDTLWHDFRGLLDYLDESQQVSLRNVAEETFRKAILLAAASHFEHRLSEDILTFVKESSNSNRLLLSFVKNKAVSRQFHTFFDWDTSNANKFFRLFGEDFGAFMSAELRADDALRTSLEAFLEIGRERNRIVHQDFASYSLEKTAEEIYDLYGRALQFVEMVPAKMRQCVPDGGS